MLAYLWARARLHTTSGPRRGLQSEAGDSNFQLVGVRVSGEEAGEVVGFGVGLGLVVEVDGDLQVTARAGELDGRAAGVLVVGHVMILPQGSAGTKAIGQVVLGSPEARTHRVECQHTT